MINEPGKKAGHRLIMDEKGMSTIEVVLIIVVLVALVLIFKNQISSMVSEIFGAINRTAKEIYQ